MYSQWPLLYVSVTRLFLALSKPCTRRFYYSAFHGYLPETFPLRDRISRKIVFSEYFRVPCLCPAYVSRETFSDAYTLSVPWWTSHRFILPSQVSFAEGCTVFQLSTSERLPLPRCQQWRNRDVYICFKHTRQGAPRSDRRFAVVYLIHCTFSSLS